jgi:hypothetical protein
VWVAWAADWEAVEIVVVAVPTVPEVFVVGMDELVVLLTTCTVVTLLSVIRTDLASKVVTGGEQTLPWRAEIVIVTCTTGCRGAWVNTMRVTEAREALIPARASARLAIGVTREVTGRSVCAAFSASLMTSLALNSVEVLVPTAEVWTLHLRSPGVQRTTPSTVSHITCRRCINSGERERIDKPTEVIHNPLVTP